MVELLDEQAKQYIGKTVLDIDVQDEPVVVLRFTDGTILKLEPRWAYDDVYMMLSDSEDE